MTCYLIFHVSTLSLMQCQDLFRHRFIEVLTSRKESFAHSSANAAQSESALVGGGSCAQTCLSSTSHSGSMIAAFAKLAADVSYLLVGMGQGIDTGFPCRSSSDHGAIVQCYVAGKAKVERGKTVEFCWGGQIILAATVY